MGGAEVQKLENGVCKGLQFSASWSGRIMMDGSATLAENTDMKEFYLGISSEGRKSFRDMKSYRRRKRWL